MIDTIANFVLMFWDGQLIDQKCVLFISLDEKQAHEQFYQIQKITGSVLK